MNTYTMTFELTEIELRRSSSTREMQGLRTNPYAE